MFIFFAPRKSPTNLSRMPRPTHPVWKYYSKVNEDTKVKAQCKFCQQVMCINSKTTVKHLIRCASASSSALEDAKNWESQFATSSANQILSLPIPQMNEENVSGALQFLHELIRNPLHEFRFLFLFSFWVFRPAHPPPRQNPVLLPFGRGRGTPRIRGRTWALHFVFSFF